MARSPSPLIASETLQTHSLSGTFPLASASIL